MNRQSMLKPAVIGGILLGVLSALPVVSCGCCIWIIGGGVLAAYLYIKESPMMVTLGQGILLGLFAGLIGTVAYGLIQIPLLYLTPMNSAEMMEQLEGVMGQFPGLPRENLEEFMKLSQSEGFFKIILISSLVVQLFVNSILAMVGGGLGVAFFEKRKTGQGEQEPQANEPPSDLPPPPPPVE